MTVRRWLARVGTGAWLAAWAWAAWGAGEITLNLKDADINTLIATVSEVTGKNFIVDPRVKAKVTVISSAPMSPEGVYETFLAVLSVNGFAALPAGEAIKLVPETNARADGGAGLASGHGLPPDDVVTRVIAIQNVSAAQLVPILRPMVAQWGQLAAYAPSNMLIVSDRAANVVRLENIIARMDQSGDRQIEMVRLQYAAAAEVVRILTQLTQQEKQTEPGALAPTVIADERSNAVLVGGDKADREKLVDLIKRLDVPVGEEGATQVVYLNYASAENLAPILEGYAKQADQARARPGGAAPAAAPVSTGATPYGESRVLADPDSNALIISGSPKTIREIRNVIAQLDIRRAQVYVEGIIAEVSYDKSSDLGIDWAILNNRRVAAASITNPSTASAISSAGQAAATGNGVSLGTAAIGLIGQGLTLAAATTGQTNFAALVKALRGDGNTNILSTPTLVTLDNEEAKLSVGQEVPFLTGSFSNTGATNVTSTGVVNPFQTIDRKDVGMTLGITPQINEGNSVKLKIDLEVSSIAAGTAGTASLITNKRTVTNSVTVDDGQILVLGGLIDDNITDSRQRVPFLSDIPLLGALFESRSVKKTKQNLMVFIRPSILRQREEADYYTARKYDYVRSVQIQSSRGAVPLVGGALPVLLPREEYERQVLPPTPPPAPVPVQPPPAVAPGSAPSERPPATAAPPAPQKPPENPPKEQNPPPAPPPQGRADAPPAAAASNPSSSSSPQRPPPAVTP